MIELYVLETCPYSQKVMNFCDENDILYKKFDITAKNNYEKLLELGGIDQVPFMYDPASNTKMYESEAIIAYIEKYINR